MNKKTREKFNKQVASLGLAGIEKKEARKLNQKELAALQGGGPCACFDEAGVLIVWGVYYDGW